MNLHIPLADLGTLLSYCVCVRRCEVRTSQWRVGDMHVTVWPLTLLGNSGGHCSPTGSPGTLRVFHSSLAICCLGTPARSCSLTPCGKYLQDILAPLNGSVCYMYVLKGCLRVCVMLVEDNFEAARFCFLQGPVLYSCKLLVAL